MVQQAQPIKVAKVVAVVVMVAVVAVQQILVKMCHPQAVAVQVALAF
jgi:hypothetical protein